jgi:hypothetical protein
MALPKLTAPEFKTEMPSTKEEIIYRPFLVKEQKLLLMASEGDDEIEILHAVENIVESCVLNKKIVARELSSFDLEFLFLRIRSKSIGETVSLTAKHDEDNECQETTEIELNLDDVNVVFDEENDPIVKLNEEIGLKMKYPTFKVIQEVNASDKTETEKSLLLIKECILQVFDEENVYEEFTDEELDNFIEDMTEDQLQSVQKFFATLPALKKEITYKCKVCGKKESVTMEGLMSFFA